MKICSKKLKGCAALFFGAIMMTGSSGAHAAASSEHIQVPIVRPAITEHHDVTFAQYFAWPETRLKMDILQPDVKGKVPAVVFVTGGGFIATPKTSYVSQRVHIAEAGYGVASVEYRVVPTGTFMDAVRDVKSAIRYLRAHADEFNIDTSRIAVMGESAGGYMAAMVGASNGVKEFDMGENLDQTSDVQAAIDIYGLSDLTKVGADYSTEVQMLHKSAGASQALFVNGVPPFVKGGAIDEYPEKAKAANPMSYISGKSAPFLLMHGDQDKLVSPSQTELLHAALREHGIESTRYVVEGATHADQYWYQPAVEKIIISFLDEKLKRSR